MAAMRWDVFCRVVDNWGDAGVCWRLCADLAGRGEAVRLWIDDPAPLAWMAPGGAVGVEVLAWRDDDAAADATPGDVVVEAFGCDPPPGFVAAMAARRPRPPVWLNLEYLSAEPYVAASHGLPSPQSAGPGRGLTKWFFFPGFGADTGGLLREPGLLAARDAFDRDRWLRERGWARMPGERVVLLFCYDNPALPALLERLADAPTLVLATAGSAARQAAPLFDGDGRRGALRLLRLPLVAQPDFDRLLWSADLNLVRGEDSLVRALWAGAPLLWQAYPQHDGVHLHKVDALLDVLLDDAGPAGAAASLRHAWRAWNGAADAGALPAPDCAGWASALQCGRDALAAQQDLTTRLLRFVAAKS